MTYSIKVRPYNEPYIKIAEEAVGAMTELLNSGAFPVDIIPSWSIHFQVSDSYDPSFVTEVLGDMQHSYSP